MFELPEDDAGHLCLLPRRLDQCLSRAHLRRERSLRMHGGNQLLDRHQCCSHDRTIIYKQVGNVADCLHAIARTKPLSLSRTESLSLSPTISAIIASSWRSISAWIFTLKSDAAITESISLIAIEVSAA